MYDMFGEHAEEQQLYHAIATVGTLLLEIGEVGKQFYLKKSSSGESSKLDSLSDSETPLAASVEESSAFLEQPVEGSTVQTLGGSTEQSVEGSTKQPVGGSTDKPIEGSTEQRLPPDGAATPGDGDNGKCSPDGESATEIVPIESVSDESSANQSDSGVELGGKKVGQDGQGDSGVADQNEAGKINEASGTSQPVDIENKNQSAATESSSSYRSSSYLADTDWYITFEQFLASVLTEQPLVKFFEKPEPVKPAIERMRNRKLARQNSTNFDSSFNSA